MARASSIAFTDMYLRRLPTWLTLAAAVFLCISARAASVSPAPRLTVLYSFTNALSPDAGVVVVANGNIFGVAAAGGTNNDGGIYEVTSTGVLTNMFWLGGTNGSMPLAPLIEDKNGNLYGTASHGGAFNNYGTVFELTSAGQLKLLLSFDSTDGSTPLGPLLIGTNGWLYGTTYSGGSNNLGTVFSLTPGNAFSTLFTFSGTNGANPAAGLIQGSNGNLYGTTQYGGANGLGTVFELTYGGRLTTLASFTNSTGAFPGGLAADTNGNFYGPTLSGGANLAGTIFRLFNSNSLQTSFTFDLTNGVTPNGPLVTDGAGNWYGTTEEGGTDGQGTIFSLSGRGSLTEISAFAGANGSYPRSGLILASNGNFYGTTSAGGAHGYGEIYELTGFAPYFIKPPAGLKWASNSTASFLVDVGGTGPISFQWMFDNTNTIPDATNSSLTVGHEQLTNSGTYTLIVSNAFGVASNSAVLSVVAPSVTIVSPPLTVSNASTNISGTATGPHGISSVLVQLNGGGWFAAAGATHWHTNLTLLPGTNIIQVESLDTLGNPSTVKSNTIFYVTVSPLTLQTNGLGSIHTNFTGTNLIVDRSYTMRAEPGAGWLFASWTGSVAATNNPLTFVMQSNMSVTANFETNPFIAAAGTYAGLFFTSNAVAEQSAGLLRSLTLKSSGAYSGQIIVKGLTHGFTGAFNAAEQSSPTIARSAAQGGPMAMSMTLNSNELTGTISGTDSGGWTSSLTAERVGKIVGSGEYTLIFPPGEGAPSNSPPGYGYALVTNHDGSVILSGAMADGTAFSQTVSMVEDGDIPFYASLYNNTGLVLAWLNTNGGLTGSNLWWIKTPSSSGLYTNGFTNLVTNALASAWTKPPASYLPSGGLNVSNSSLALDYGIAITNSTLLKTLDFPTNSLSGVFYPRTGLLRVTFGNGTGRDTTTGYAAFLGTTSNGFGYFVTKTNAGTITISP